MIRERTSAEQTGGVPRWKVPLARMAIEVPREVHETRNDFFLHLFEAAVNAYYDNLSAVETQRLNGPIER